jgi:mRNA interferase HigB
MNVLSRPAINAAIAAQPFAEKWLNAWWTTAKKQQWQSLDEVRLLYPSCDQYGRCLIFDAPRGYRLIVGLNWADEDKGGTIFVKHFLSHAEYDKDAWKKDA